MRAMMTRKGITPVIAIVLLLMMTVAVAGGAYAWMQGIIGGQQNQAEFEQNTELAFRGLSCNATGFVDFTLKNDGSTTLDASAVDIFVYNVSTDELATNAQTSKASPTDFQPGSIWSQEDVNLDISLVNGNEYEIRFEFVNNYNFPVEGTCQA